MTGPEFQAIRQAAGLSLDELGALLRINDERSLRRMEEGTKIITGPVSLLMEMIRDGHLIVER